MACAFSDDVCVCSIVVMRNAFMLTTLLGCTVAPVLALSQAIDHPIANALSCQALALQRLRRSGLYAQDRHLSKAYDQPWASADKDELA